MPGATANVAEQSAVAAAVTDQVEYPDHLWAAQSLRHSDSVLYAASALKQYFDNRKDVLVASELVVYYQPGDNQSWLQPDVLVACGVPYRPRRTVYKLWEEGQAPDFILEVASPATVKRDAGFKARVYAALGVREYWRLDPDPAGRLLERALEGYRWQAGRYERLASVKRHGRETLRSEALGLDLRAAGNHEATFLVLQDPRTGKEFDGRPGAAESRASAAEERASTAEKRENAVKEELRAAQNALRVAREEARGLKRQIRELNKGQAHPRGRAV